MDTISQVPDDVNLGNGGIYCDYSVWTPGTRVDFANVNWDSEYRDIVWYGSDTDAINDILGSTNITARIDAMTYLAPGRPIRVNIPFSSANRFNYLVVRNPAQPAKWDIPTTFFYFINHVEYVAPNTTELVVQLDVWQTYSRKVTPGQGFLVQGHWGLNEGYDQYGRGNYAIPEGFDLGSEYMVAAESEYTDRPEGVVIVIAGDVLAQAGKEEPITESAKGVGGGEINGCDVLYVGLDQIGNFFKTMGKWPWLASSIQSIMLVPGSAVSLLPDTYSLEVDVLSTPQDESQNGTRFRVVANSPANIIRRPLIPNFRNAILTHIENITGLPARRFKKLATSPYSYITVTTNTGSPITVKPERVSQDDLNVLMVPHVSPPSPKIMYAIEGMGAQNSSADPFAGDGLAAATGFTALPQGTVPSNNGLLAQAGMSHSIAYTETSAGMQRELARDAASAQRENINSQLQAEDAFAANQRYVNRRTTDESNWLAHRNMYQGGFNNMAGGVMGGMTMGPLGGMIGLGGAINENHKNRGAVKRGEAAATEIMNTQNNANQWNRAWADNAARQVGDRNKDIAMRAADVDYEIAVGAAKARKQDAAVVPPSMVGQMTGEGLVVERNGFQVVAKVMVPNAVSLRQIMAHWQRYGYQRNEYVQVPQDWQVMKDYTYWKMLDFHISSGVCPQEFRETIRGIFETGVTVWRNSSNIGRFSFDLNA